MNKLKLWYKAISKNIPAMIKQIVDKDLLTQSAALSYYCALSLAPFIILTITAFSFLGADTESAFISQVTGIVGENAAEAILIIIKTAKENKEIRGISGILGLLTLFISASAVFSQLKITIIAIFSDKKTNCDVEEPEQSWGQIIRDRVLSIGIMVGFIFLSLVSLMLSSALPLVLPESTGFFWIMLNWLISLMVYIGVFFIVFYYISHRKIKKINALIGALISALLFVIGKTLISLYITQSAVGSSYGAAGSMIVLLVWVYYSSFIIFLAGVVTKNLPKIKSTYQDLMAASKK